ncbi:oxidoreductase, partial [Methylococcaceae bacterium CS2]
SGELQVEKLDLANHFQLEVEHFCDCVLNQKPLKLSLQDAKDNCAIILAALESVEQKRTIQLN